MFSIFLLSLLLLTLSSAAVEKGIEPRPPPEGLFSEAPSPGIGAWPVALFARQQQYVCTDPVYSVQCLAVTGCCQSTTYCCPNNLPFCCTVGDICQVIAGRQGCCPSTSETCDGRQCNKAGSVCCNDYNHVCNPGEDCCKAGCCAIGTKCCGDVCCDAGNECCPGANGGQGGCCWPGTVCCGDECCDSQNQYCSSGVCMNRVTPTSTVVRTTGGGITVVTVEAQRTGGASGLRGGGRKIGLIAVPLGVAFELGVGF